MKGTDVLSPLRETYRMGWTPPPWLTVSEWADRYRIVRGAEAGRYHVDRTPYWREPMDRLSAHDPSERIVIIKGAQIGYTTVIENWIGYIIHHAPGPTLYVQPTVDIARKASKDRLAPMISECEALRGLVAEAKTRYGSNTVLEKDFPGGPLIITGANSAVGLRHTSIQNLPCDEIDAWPADVGGEGDPLDLATRRTATYEGQRKLLQGSTPTFDGSRIMLAFQESDQRYHTVPCPHCGEYQIIGWNTLHSALSTVKLPMGTIEWPEGHPEKAAMICALCGAVIDASYKGRMLAKGIWVPTAEGDGHTFGYQISSLYSPPGWYSWPAAARDFLKAKEGGAARLQVWVNTVLGEPWRDGGKPAVPEELLARAEVYPAEVPAAVLAVVAGIDVQDDRIEMEVVGFAEVENQETHEKGVQSWGIEKKVLWGDPYRLSVWALLDQALQVTYKHELGYSLPIMAACIDSGHATHRVYRFCRDKEGRRVFAVKGIANYGHQLVGSPSKKRTGKSPRPCKLFPVGTDQGSFMVYSALRKAEAGPDYCHFPTGRGYDLEHMKQLCSMTAKFEYDKRGRRTRTWQKKSGQANEAFDMRVYALAALQLLHPAWAPLARAREDKAARIKSGEAPPPVVQAKQERKQHQPRPRSGWVSSWKR